MTSKVMFTEILKRLDEGRLQVQILREEQQLVFPQSISSPQDAYTLLKDEMIDAQQEMLVLLCLDTKNNVRWKGIIFVGSLNASVIHPREIYKRAILESAASIVLVHNHPSGDCAPSPEDIKTTRQMVDAGKILDIPVLDHIIIGNGDYASMKELRFI